MMRRAFLASIAGLLSTRRAQATQLAVRGPGEVTAALATVGRGAQSGLMRPAVVRMAASTVVPWGVASAGSTESARAKTCSAASGGSDPAARSAPISTPANVVNATICCWCGCQGASSDIGSSMGTGENPMLDAKGAGYQPAPDAALPLLSSVHVRSGPDTRKNSTEDTRCGGYFTQERGRDG